MNNNGDETGRERPRINENVTLKEIAHKARKRAVNKRIQPIEKQMDSMPALLQELRDGQRRLNKRNCTKNMDMLEPSHRRHTLGKLGSPM